MVAAEAAQAALTTALLGDKVKLLAKRTPYGTAPKKAVIPEDASREALWHWEVVTAPGLLPAGAGEAAVRAARRARDRAGKQVRALRRVVDAIEKHPGDEARISKEEERVIRFRREEEAERQKKLQRAKAAADKAAEKATEKAAAKKDKEKSSKEREKAQKAAAKEAEKHKKEQEKKEAEDRAVRETEKMSQKLLSFFKKPASAGGAAAASGGGAKSPAKGGAAAAAAAANAGPAAAAGTEPAPEAAGVNGSGAGGGAAASNDAAAPGTAGAEARGNGDGASGSASGRIGSGWGETECAAFEAQLREGLPTNELLASVAASARKRSASTASAGATARCCSDQQRGRQRRPKRIKIDVTVDGGGVGAFGGGAAYSEIKEVMVANRMKLLQFHSDLRPPYWGTWSRRSGIVSGRAPLKRDEALLDYEVDSEAEWEEEEPTAGEELKSDDDADTEPED
ncbi:unnamed protein product, partial [Phaeothamnion confervicola]